MISQKVIYKYDPTESDKVFIIEEMDYMKYVCPSVMFEIIKSISRLYECVCERLHVYKCLQKNGQDTYEFNFVLIDDWKEEHDLEIMVYLFNKTVTGLEEIGDESVRNYLKEFLISACEMMSNK